MARPKGLSVADLEKQVAEQIIDMMKIHGLKWTQQWQRSKPACNGLNGHVYKGSNILTTWIYMMVNDQDDPRFVPRAHLFTKFNGNTRIGIVRKGEKGTPIVFYKDIDKEGPNGEDESYRVARIHHVWHVSQLDDLREDLLVDPTIGETPTNPAKLDDTMVDWVLNTKADIRHGGDRAYYNIPRDYVQMPPLAQFYGTQAYYSTLLHELTHWTGAEKRLNRKFGTKNEIEDYAFEELVAELGSAMLGTSLGIQVGPREDNAAYVKSWIGRLKNEPRLIFDAAREASKAMTFLEDLQPCEIEEAA